jgi:hypothetical protein
MKTDIGGSTSRFRELLAADLHSAEHGGQISARDRRSDRRELPR